MPSDITVAILGGGVGGLSVAHELARTGGPFKITVYEERATVGGKADSQDAGLGGTNGRKALLGEHGFRFFPGFYRYITQAMAEVMHTDGRPVIEHLVESDMTGIAYPGEPLIVLPRRPRRSYAFDLYRMLASMAQNDEVMRFPSADLARAALARLKFITSCEARRVGYEQITWLKFLGEDKLSTRYKQFEASLNSTLSAMGPEDTNARVIGEIGMQFILGSLRTDERKDALLDGPTRYTWLEMWRRHLELKGVSFKTAKVQSLETVTAGGKPTVKRAVFEDGTWAEAEYFVCAMPVGDAARVMPTAVIGSYPMPLFNGSPDSVLQLAKMQKWMVGAQFYLKEDVPFVKGHFFLPTSPWALSGVSQNQFWRKQSNIGPTLETKDLYGDGSVKGVLSVAISAWDVKDDHPTEPKTARECKTPEEVLERTLAQLQKCLGSDLADSNISSKHLDNNVTVTLDAFGVPTWENRFALLVHPPDSRKWRPPAWSAGVPNLMLAADYVDTFTQLATMEGANEAARAAAIAICKATGVAYNGLEPAPLHEESIFDFAKKLDKDRFDDGKDHLLDTWPFRDLGDGALGFELIDTAMRLLHLIASPP
jgi:uncharacterized protein with NAD-binding domain and iron-sulfur cluster